ncbi:MAG: NAD(+) diphosphatase [Lachnospiraceae bacterium]|nr:NAD(+) diphosphatase [Lachnospiraceae bacterium]
MIHEIFPEEYDPQYINKKAAEKDTVILNRGNRILAVALQDTVHLPSIGELSEITGRALSGLIKDSWYLFSISGQSFFTTKADADGIEEIPDKEALAKISKEPGKHYFFMNINKFRELSPMVMVYAAATGMHMVLWKQSRKFCGCCGSRTKPSETERAMVCENCGMIEYPRISPAVIVAITNGDRILLVRNKLGYYKKLALVSGFVEIGESFEHAVIREVKEEVGLNIKNIRYYKNQPWGLSGAQMIGYTAELDGDDTITMQESELSEAAWYERKDIPEYAHRLSVGNELIHAFKYGEFPF